MHLGRFEIWAPLDLLQGSGPVRPGIIFPRRSHLRLPWAIGYDQYPLDILEEKRALLEESHGRATWLWLEHDPATALVRVTFDGCRTDVKQIRAVQEPHP